MLFKIGRLKMISSKISIMQSKFISHLGARFFMHNLSAIKYNPWVLNRLCQGLLATVDFADKLISQYRLENYFKEYFVKLTLLELTIYAKLHQPNFSNLSSIELESIYGYLHSQERVCHAKELEHKVKLLYLLILSLGLLEFSEMMPKFKSQRAF